MKTRLLVVFFVSLFAMGAAAAFGEDGERVPSFAAKSMLDDELDQVTAAGELDGKDGKSFSLNFSFPFDLSKTSIQGPVHVKRFSSSFLDSSKVANGGLGVKTKGLHLPWISVDFSKVQTDNVKIVTGRILRPRIDF